MNRLRCAPATGILLAAWLAVSTTAAADTSNPAVAGALSRLAAGSNSATSATGRRLRVIYFHGADQTPRTNYEVRIDRVVKDIRGFYATNMAALGLGPLTFPIETNTAGRVVVHVVKGRKPRAEYDYQCQSEVMDECRQALKDAGVDPAREVCLYVLPFSFEEGNRHGVRNSPYFGGVFGERGYAFQTDASFLDSASLPATAPFIEDEQYGHVSLGRWNSIFVGGMCHELGHALGLPHDAASSLESPRGTSLMGDGNRTYGEDRRHDGKGSFLTLADGLRLLSHPLFCGTISRTDTWPTCKIESLRLDMTNGGITVRGRIAGSSPAPYALLGYDDPEGGDVYDATTWVGTLGSNDSFTLHVGDFRPGAGELRLVVCHVNGKASTFAFPFRVDRAGTPDFSLLRVRTELAEPLAAYVAGDRAGAAAAAQKYLTTAPTNDPVCDWARHLINLAGRKAPALWTLTNVATSVNSVALCDARWDEVEVGYARPLRDEAMAGGSSGTDFPLLSVGGRLRAHGLFLHAPSRAAFRLGGQWNTFSGTAGLQAGADRGSVSFTIRGDGRELWHSRRMGEHDSRNFSINVQGVDLLELIVSDGNDGNHNDWSVWADPVLTRGAR